VLPLAGWSVAPGLAAATSMNGLPGGTSLFTTPDSGTSNVVLDAVESALKGQTVRLGRLLAPAGISTIVVMNSSAPELQGVQTVPLHPVPSVLLTALGRQSDLSLELQTKSVEVFSNSLFHGIVSESVAGTPAPTPVFSSTSNTGPVIVGATVQAGVAPASAFGLNVNGQPASRAIDLLWTPIFHVSATASGGVATAWGRGPARPSSFALERAARGFHIVDVAARMAGIRLDQSTRMALHRSAPAGASATREGTR